MSAKEVEDDEKQKEADEILFTDEVCVFCVFCVFAYAYLCAYVLNVCLLWCECE